MWRISLVLLICLFAGLAYSNPALPTLPKGEQKNQTHTKDNEQPTSTDLRGTESSPLFIKVAPPLSVEPSPAEHAYQSNGFTSPEWWLVWVTLILAAITAILAGYTAKLWGATKSLADDAEQTATRQASEMQTSLRIAQESADAAKNMAATMENTAERQLRAYVFIHAAEIKDLAAGFRPYAYVVIKNTGQTPAYDLSMVGGIALGVSWETLDHATQPKAAEISQNDLATGAVVSQKIQALSPLVVGGRERLVDGSMTLWVYGKINYRDAFNRDRFTEYRFQIGGTSGVQDTQMATCPEGNHAT